MDGHLLEIIKELNRFILTIREECFEPFADKLGIFKPRSVSEQGKRFSFTFVINKEECPVTIQVDKESFITAVMASNKQSKASFPTNYSQLPEDQRKEKDLQDFISKITKKPDEEQYILLQIAAYCFECARNEALRARFLLLTLASETCLPPIQHLITIGQNWDKGKGPTDKKLADVIDAFAKLGALACKTKIKQIEEYKGLEITIKTLEGEISKFGSSDESDRINAKIEKLSELKKQIAELENSFRSFYDKFIILEGGVLRVLETFKDPKNASLPQPQLTQELMARLRDLVDKSVKQDVSFLKKINFLLKLLSDFTRLIELLDEGKIKENLKASTQNLEENLKTSIRLIGEKGNDVSKLDQETLELLKENLPGFESLLSPMQSASSSSSSSPSSSFSSSSSSSSPYSSSPPRDLTGAREDFLAGIPEKYREEMRRYDAGQDLTWGGHLELEALAGYFGVKVMLLLPHTRQTLSVRPVGVAPGAETIALIYTGDHYTVTEDYRPGREPIIRADGNCLFRAFYYALTREIAPDDAVKDLRRIAVDNISDEEIRQNFRFVLEGTQDDAGLHGPLLAEAQSLAPKKKSSSFRQDTCKEDHLLQELRILENARPLFEKEEEFEEMLRAILLVYNSEPDSASSSVISSSSTPAPSSSSTSSSRSPSSFIEEKLKELGEANAKIKQASEEVEEERKWAMNRLNQALGRGESVTKKDLNRIHRALKLQLCAEARKELFEKINQVEALIQAVRKPLSHEDLGDLSVSSNSATSCASSLSSLSGGKLTPPPTSSPSASKSIHLSYEQGDSKEKLDTPGEKAEYCRQKGITEHPAPQAIVKKKQAVAMASILPEVTPEEPSAKRSPSLGS